MSNPHNGPPKEVEGRTTPHHQGDRPSTSQTNQLHSHAAADAPHSSRTCGQMRARRAASQRLAALDSGRSDPWSYPEPGERGYADAAVHLLELGLTPAPNPAALRAMWTAGGQSRRAAEVIAKRWGLAS
jgi:hypothetical protein